MNRRVYMRSLISSWGGYGANIIIWFFLSPIVVHSLGNASYGVWSLLMTVTGYLGLVEIGVRVSTGRYINYYLGKNQTDQVNHVVNTSLAFYCFASLLVLLLAAVVGEFFTDIFPKIDVALASQAQVILLLMAVNVWLGLWSATFQQLLYANNRFDLVNGISVVSLVVRAAGTLMVLRWGGDLIALAMVLVISSAASFVLFVAASRWKGVKVTFAKHLASWRCFREIFSFGAWSFIANVSSRIIDYTNAAVIGILLGAAEITYYAIGYMLLDNVREMLAYIVRVLTPDIQKSAGAQQSLGNVMVKASNVTMLLAVPMLVGLLVLGKDFIHNWMGPGYEKCAWVLIIVTLSQFTNIANMSCGTILNAMGYVRLLALLSGIEASANLALSVVFVKFFGLGIYGVALGTTIPSFVMTGMILLLVACRRTQVNIFYFLKYTTVRWVTATLLLLPLSLMMSHFVGDGGWGTFCLKGILLLLIYVPIAMLIVLGWTQSKDLLKRLPISLHRRPVPKVLEESEARLD